MGSIPWGELAELGYGGPTIANLKLEARYEADWPAAIAWTRDWIVRNRAAPRPPETPNRPRHE